MLKKNSSKIIIIIAIIVIAVVATIIFCINKDNKYSVKLENIEKSDAVYFLLQQDSKYGVIDKDGNVVVKPEYESVTIPNPTKDVFICSDDNDSSKVLNNKGEQILSSYSNVQAITISAITSLVPYEKTTLIYEENQLYGIMDFDGNKITDAEYEKIENIDYKEGYLRVKKSGLYGVINIKGTKIIKEEYDNITSDGYYDEKTKYENAGFIIRTKTDEGYRYGYATTKGKIILEPKYNEINRITEIENSKDIYLITSVNGKYGLAKNSKTILENDFTQVEFDKTNNLLIVQKNNAQGVYNLAGKNIIPIDYDSITAGGEYLNANKENKILIFDKDGNNIDTNITSREKVADNYWITIDENNDYNIQDKNGNNLLKNKYSYIEFFTDNLFIATSNSKAGVINSNGDTVVPFEYDSIQKVDDANCLLAVILSNKKISIINKEGKVQEGIAGGTAVQKDGYIKLYSSTDAKYYTLDGNETTYKEISPNNQIYAFKQNDKWGFKDGDGKVIVECKYDMVTEQNIKYVGIKKDGKWGVMDVTGNIVIAPTYKLSWDDTSFLAQYYEIISNLGLPVYCGDETK